MVSHRVIADSDAEDDDDGPLSPLREDVLDPPEIEPLSPHRLGSSRATSDTHNQISDTTDQSFFANVYDEQQSRALQQSHLIEHIVRQTQRASGSSGEVSLPAKGKGRKTNTSSATDVTSPVVLKKPGNQPSLFSDDASVITTPRKSLPGEWDIPSSPEDAFTSKSVKSAKTRRDKTYGKRKSQPGLALSPAAANIFTADNDASGEALEDVGVHDTDELSWQPMAKKRKISLHDSTLPEAATTTKFYVAQSNMTTMQKLEYEKVHVSQNSYAGFAGPSANQKSSGMTTVAYPTPSRYASSSGPPLPWEAGPALDLQPEGGDVIDITSSPDIIAASHIFTRPKSVGTSPMDSHAGNDQDETVAETVVMKSQASKKRTKRLKSTQDEDELVQSDPETLENYRGGLKRKPRREICNSPSQQDGDEGIELILDHGEEVPIRENSPRQPSEEASEVVDLLSEIPATESPSHIGAPRLNDLKAKITPQPKKRGRKKKQPENIPIVQDEEVAEAQTVVHEQAAAAKDPEKPKKKRGRPRKSETLKGEKEAAPELESRAKDNQREQSKPDQADTSTKKLKTGKEQAQNQEEENEDISPPLPNESEGEAASPLREIDRNSRAPAPTEDVPAEPADRGPPPKVQEKGSSMIKPTPTAMASQPKVSYRVGLSKRSRISSLLKSIKR